MIPVDLSPLSQLLLAAGVIISVGSAAIGGLKAHRLLARHASSLAAAVPSGALILAGAAIGALLLLRAVTLNP